MAERKSTFTPARPLRCAVYTRKSTEEGLDQAFNSLDAQREACEAYIVSQHHEGWELIPAAYDDGGFSGGNVDRPGLKRLLAEVKAGKVDVIVVYKVDRLTRSLADFAKIVEILDTAGASFVSVTQAFNTTTSMGRLTLNVLLSFAQFEREVTSERIRDKFAASRAKGMWMGGVVPLGYEVQSRKLVVCEEEAERVRFMFARYLELGSIAVLVDDLAARGIRSKCRVRLGKDVGDNLISKGALAALLQNPVYIGIARYKGQLYPGEHEGVIAQSVWDQVQALIERNRLAGSTGERSRNPSLLAGMLRDGLGRSMTPSHATKNMRRYHYYVSLIQPDAKKGDRRWRLPAGEIDGPVLQRLTTFLTNPAALVAEIGELVEQGEKLDRIVQRLGEIGKQLPDGAVPQNRALLQRLSATIQVEQQRIVIHVDRQALIERGGSTVAGVELSRSRRCIELVIPAALAQRGQELRLAFAPGESSAPTHRDSALIGLLVEAHAIPENVLVDQPDEKGALRVSRDRRIRLAKLRYLAPDIVAAIFEGRQPPSLTTRRLFRIPNLPICWHEQRMLLGFT